MDVAKIAKLARLQLDDKEAAVLANDLEAILAYAKELDALDLKDVPPTAHALLTQTPTRDDVIALGLSDPLMNAPDKDGTAFRVPKVIE